MSWTSRLRSAAFERIPRQWRPPAAYHYYKVRSLLERELPVVCALLRPGLCAVDAGANEGVYTHAFARTGARVEAFEPEPHCTAILKAYERRHPNVRVHAEALGATEGWATLHVPLRSGRPLTTHATLESPVATSERHDVKVRTLDSCSLGDVAVLKIDVEGHEMDVLTGARDTIARCRPTLLVEIEQRHLRQPMRDVFAAIATFGYSGTFLHPSCGAMPLDAFAPSEHQNPAAADVPRALYINNFIFTPLEAPRRLAVS
jgi:FkbM family methyltransferase